MKKLKDDVIEEIRRNDEAINEDKIKKLSEGIEKVVGETTFLSHISSPATIIGAIVGYAVGNQLPDNALVQVAISVLSAATTEHIITSIEKEALSEEKYHKSDVDAAYQDVDKIYSYARNTLSQEEQLETRMEATAYRAMMRNPRTRMMII